MLHRFAMLILFAAATTSWGAEPPANVLKLATQKVIVFKDGHCLFHKHASAVTDAQSECFSDDVPDAAVLGSFWALPTAGKLVSMRAGWETVVTSVVVEAAATSYVEILLANQGKRVRLEMNDQQTISGTIVESGISGSQVILRTEDGDLLLNASNIKSMAMQEMKRTFPRTVTTSARTKRLTFRFDQPDQELDLNLLYFRPGIRWIPTYRVSLSEDPAQKFAGIALQAEILNEAESLDEVPVDIVVGVPNFRFRELPSPLTLEQVLRQTLQAAAPQLMSNFRNDLSNALYTQRTGEFRSEAAQGNATIESGELRLPDELTASGAHDLFVYHLPKLSLKTGERIAVSIFNAEQVPYKDIYTWDLHVTREEGDAAPGGSGVKSPLRLSRNEIWHQVELTNNTELPWTTGAALLMQGQQPLSQELLTYTSPKDACRIPVTVSVETRGTCEEQETGRDLKGLTWGGSQYARIDKLTNLHLCNNKSVAIEVEISLRLAGKAESASHEGKITIGALDPADWPNYRWHAGLNNSSRVTWKVTLEPGETFEPEVSYSFFTGLW